MSKREKMNGHSRNKKNMFDYKTQSRSPLHSPLIFGFSVLTNEWENFKSEKSSNNNNNLLNGCKQLQIFIQQMQSEKHRLLDFSFFSRTKNLSPCVFTVENVSSHSYVRACMRLRVSKRPVEIRTMSVYINHID